MAAAAKTAPAAGAILSQALAENARLKAENTRLRAENARMRDLLKWEQQVFSVPNVKPADKLVLAVTRREVEYQRQKRGREEADNAPVDLYRAAIAERVAVSPATVGDSWKKLAEIGAIEKKQRYVANAAGEKVPQLSIALTDIALSNPRALAPVEARGQGGRTDRRRCGCGSERLIVRVQIICQDCGAVLEVQERPVNPPADPQLPTTEEQLEATEEGASPDISCEGQLDLQVYAPAFQPAITPAADSPDYCPETVNHRHSYAQWRTADYRRICVYCSKPEAGDYVPVPMNKTRPLEAGDIVRILDTVEHRYPECYRRKPGVTVSRTGQKWLVDYGAIPGGWGRYQVDWTHLQHIQPVEKKVAPDATA